MKWDPSGNPEGATLILFNQLDGDDSGYVDVSEVKSSLKKAKQEDVKALMTELNKIIADKKDNEKFITLQEWQDQMAKTKHEMEDKAKADGVDDAKIDEKVHKEFTEYLVTLHKIVSMSKIGASGGFGKFKFPALDENEMKLAMEVFFQYDTDGNGVWSAQELKDQKDEIGPFLEELNISADEIKKGAWLMTLKSMKKQKKDVTAFLTKCKAAKK